ncbi:MAG: hypothetical protein M1832_004306 [Thelocarpon impressellum]|nr:MAG: hypothetical protein M1832_004306 [Thelocarpon impressellum]
MPPKRRTPKPAAPGKKPRASKLARENDISAEEEAEIREAFDIFAKPAAEDAEDGPQEDAMPLADVHRALIALGLPPTNDGELSEITNTLDPTDSGSALYAPFLSVCALKMHARTSTSQAAEVEAAFRLFTSDTPGPISLAHLRRVARELKEDVPEELLRDMVLEANGGRGATKGVRLEEFEGVMRRAGVFR